jgi:hypothetical protein
LRIRGKHIGTFDLITDEEYADGLERAERELPEELDYGHRVARRCGRPTERSRVPHRSRTPLTRSSEAEKESKVRKAVYTRVWVPVWIPGRVA